MHRSLVLLAALLAFSGCLAPMALDSSATTSAKSPAAPQPKPAPGTTLSESASSSPLTLTMLDVGWGEAMVLRQGNRTALIDTGTEEAARRVVLPYLAREGVTRIDTMVLTHAHPDHAGGCVPVLAKHDVGKVVYPGRGIASPAWGACLEAVEDSGARKVYGSALREGDRLELMPGVHATILSANWKGSTQHEATAVNEGSVVLLLEHEGVRVVLTGDGHCTTEARILENGYDVSADVLKAGHHGEPNGSCAPFLEAVEPDIALASRSTPLSDAVNDRFKAAGVRSYSTYSRGTITVTMGGGEWAIRTAR